MSDTWVPADVNMQDYWADAIGGEYRPVKHGKHSSFHPKTVKAVLDSVRGTEVADVIVGLVFALTKSDDLRRWANDQLLEEMKRSAALEEENQRLREALEKIAAPTYGTELWNTHKERAEIYRTHLTNFQTIARAALQERHER